MTFKFKLESVLDLRKTKEGEAMLEVQYAKESLKKEEDKLNILLVENTYVEKDLTSGSIDKMRQATLYKEILNDKLRVQRHMVSIAEENLQNKNDELIESHKKLLAIEKLKDKRLNEYEEAEKKKEQSELDEFSMLNHNRDYGWQLK